MDFKIDVRIAELLASRLCHDLVGPIGAIGNGLELLSDDEFGMADDAMQLTVNSARQASNILQYFRLAYGMAGARVGPDYTPLRDLAGFRTGGELPMALADSCELRGSLSVEISRGAEGIDCVVTANGQDAHLRPESLVGLQDGFDLDELSPRGVHGYFTRIMAKRLGSDLVIETPGADSVRFSVTLAAA